MDFNKEDVYDVHMLVYKYGCDDFLRLVHKVMLVVADDIELVEPGLSDRYAETALKVRSLLTEHKNR